MRKWFEIIIAVLLSAVRERRELALENLALRQQLAVVKFRCPRPRLTKSDRIFWLILSRVWSNWREALHVVQSATVVRRHRQRFQSYWRRKGRCRGRPTIDTELRQSIRQISQANPLWGAPRIHGELLKIGIEVSQATVSIYIVTVRKPPSQTWRTFLDNHAKDFVSLDFLTVPTATFRVLFVLVILSHDRRRILHFNVTKNPTAAWTARQLIEACGMDEEPKYLLRDRDRIYGNQFANQAVALGIQEVVTRHDHLGKTPMSSE